MGGRSTIEAAEVQQRVTMLAMESLAFIKGLECLLLQHCYMLSDM